MFGIVKKNVYCIIKWNSYASDHTKYVLSSRQKFKIQPLLILIRMNTVKNFTTIHFQLN